MSRVSACATRPAAAATITARKLMNTTRRSTSDLSGGTRAASRVGASEGATGSASVVAPVITSSTGIAAPYSAPRTKATLFRDQTSDFGQCTVNARASFRSFGDDCIVRDMRVLRLREL